MIADTIKKLREQNELTQASLAKRLGITRSSVNAWEMGITVPSTQYVIELANLFDVSTDYILDVNNTNALNTAGLNDEDLRMVYGLIEHLKRKNSNIKALG